ncbi:MAG: hypothetical protein BGO39_11720 [Chloroflexi bacterium 54-19]|nr:MAG: hypothetical protein BGO39_11720 [Chloroflexi bacterium 54-19]
MNDFNRIAYAVKNDGILRGLLFLPLFILYTYQILTTNQILNIFTENLLLDFVLYFGVPVIVIVFTVVLYFYYKSWGFATSYKQSQKKLDSSGVFLPAIFGLTSLGIFGIIFLNTGILTGLFLALGVIFLPNFKGNLQYRKFVFIIALATFVASLVPLDLFFSFKFRFDKGITSSYSALITCLLLTGVFNHFLFLKLVRPIRADSIKNSPASADPVMGDPVNLTIMATLANCQNADFVFLRKISQIEETGFYRRIYGLENGGLLYTYRSTNAFHKNKLVASITPLGWEIINRIYNGLIPEQAHPKQPVLNY